MERLLRLYHSGLAAWILTWCTLEKTHGDCLPVCCFVVDGDPLDHLGCCMMPMLPVYATATVVVTVGASTRCTWLGLTGPLDAE